jgi:chromate transport protein ChrA
MRHRTWSALIVLVASTAIFWQTAYPTITWWDSSEYSLAAGTLGVASAPGSLLLTLLGWPFSQLSWSGSPAHTVNLLAGALAGMAAALVYLIAVETLDLAGIDKTEHGLRDAGVALGALTFAFATTLWEYATQFTPYILSAVFTGLILLTMVRWWRDADDDHAWRYLAVLGLVFGLDFSVHRTNALLIPSVLAWILIRRPRTLRPRGAAWGAAGLVVGLSVQFLAIPISAHTTSPLNFFDLSSWSGFWDFVSLKSRGGGFLFQLYPRKSPLWANQAHDFLHVLGANFAPWGRPAYVLGVLPAVLAIVGLYGIGRHNRRLAVACAVVLVLQGAIYGPLFQYSGGLFQNVRSPLPARVPDNRCSRCVRGGDVGVVRRPTVETRAPCDRRGAAGHAARHELAYAGCIKSLLCARLCGECPHVAAAQRDLLHGRRQRHLSAALSAGRGGCAA